MALERTFSIVKPDGVQKNLVGEVYRRFEQAGLRIVAARMTQLTQAQAEGFYAVHRERPFFKDLCEFMTSGPVIVIALEREDAVGHWRRVIGATDPAKADAGTIRKLYGASLGENAVHGSDSVENGRIECAYYFSGSELG
jgi:nucleoside-diphosphate kinase